MKRKTGFKLVRTVRKPTTSLSARARFLSLCFETHRTCRPPASISLGRSVRRCSPAAMTGATMVIFCRRRLRRWMAKSLSDCTLQARSGVVFRSPPPPPPSLVASTTPSWKEVFLSSCQNSISAHSSRIVWVAHRTLRHRRSVCARSPRSSRRFVIRFVIRFVKKIIVSLYFKKIVPFLSDDRPYASPNTAHPALNSPRRSKPPSRKGWARKPEDFRSSPCPTTARKMTSRNTAAPCLGCLSLTAARRKSKDS